jgi:hypothetical protein
VIALGRIQFATPWVLAFPSCSRSGGSFGAAGRCDRPRPRPGQRSARRAADAVHALLFRNLLPVHDRRPVETALGCTRRTRRAMNQIVPAIDSELMLAQDFTPNNRPEVAKDAVNDSSPAHERPHRRRRVLASGRSRRPLTTDYPVVNMASTISRPDSSRTGRPSEPPSRRRPIGCATHRADRA